MGGEEGGGSGVKGLGEVEKGHRLGPKNILWLKLSLT